jgi:hypothetical protein
MYSLYLWHYSIVFFDILVQRCALQVLRYQIHITIGVYTLVKPKNIWMVKFWEYFDLSDQIMLDLDINKLVLLINLNGN